MATNEDLLSSLMNEQPAASGNVFRESTTQSRPAAVRGYDRAKPRRVAKEPLLDRLAPAWAHQVADKVAGEPADFRSAIAVVYFLVLLFGLGLFAGGGYWSIQAIRVILNALHIPVVTAGIPSLAWWLIPIGNTAIQVICRRVWRPAWWASLWYDATTTGVSVALPVTGLFAGLGVSFPLVAQGIGGAIIGMAFALGAEFLVFGSLLVVRTAVRR